MHSHHVLPRVDLSSAHPSYITKRLHDDSEDLVATYSATQSAMSSPETLLDQGFGYGILVSLSIVFGLIIIVAVWMQERYLSEKSDRSEMYVKHLGSLFVLPSIPPKSQR